MKEATIRLNAPSELQLQPAQAWPPAGRGVAVGFGVAVATGVGSGRGARGDAGAAGGLDVEVGEDLGREPAEDGRGHDAA